MSDSESSPYAGQSGSDDEGQGEQELKRVDHILEANEKYAFKISCEKPMKHSVAKLTSTEDGSLLALFNEVEEQVDELLKAVSKYAKFLFGKPDDEKQVTYIDRQPSILQGGVLTKYQIEGMNWMIQLYENGINGILADQMGLGKTIQTISLIAFLAQYKQIKGPHVVVAPLSTIGNWENEFKKWYPECRVVKLRATREEREQTLKSLGYNNFDVIVTSYEGLVAGLSKLSRFRFTYLVVDEAHKLKSDETLLRKHLMSVSCRFKLLLTGTPLQNNPHELWSLLNFIMPKLFNSSELFDTWFEINKQIAQLDKINETYQMRNLKLIEKVKLMIRPFMLRRTKDEIEQKLPPKKEIHLYVQMTPKQQEYYKRIILDKKLYSDARSLQNRLIHLRKICLHLYMFPETEDPTLPPLGEHLIENSGKLKVLDMFLKKLFAEKHKVLIFSQFSTLLNILEDYCNYRKYKFCRLDGSTKLEDREAQIASFQEPNSDIFIFMLSTRAGGLGITLTAADTVIIYDSDFNPQQDQQAMDRAHRIGQKKPVMVYRLVCRNTVEEKIVERQQIRLRWEQLVIESGGNAQLSSQLFKKDDLRSLTSYGASEILKDEPYTEEDIETLLKRGEELTEQMKNELDKRFNIIKKDTQTLDLGYKSINIYEFFSNKKNADDNEVLEKYMNQQNLLQMSRAKQKNLSQYLSHVEIKPCQWCSNPAKYTALKKRQNDHEIYQTLISDTVDFIEDTEVKDLSKKEAQELAKIEAASLLWSERDYDSFVSACALLGRKNVEEIANRLDKPIKEIERLIELFNEHFTEIENGVSSMKKIEIQERRAEIDSELEQVLQDLFNSYPNLLYMEDLPFFEKEKSPYQVDNDKLFLWATHQAGFGRWAQVKKIVQEDPYAQFDQSLQFLTETRLKHRVHQLLNLVRKFLAKRKTQSKKQSEARIQENEKEEKMLEEEKEEKGEKGEKEEPPSRSRNKKKRRTKGRNKSKGQSKSQSKSNSKSKSNSQKRKKPTTQKSQGKSILDFKLKKQIQH